MGAMTIGAPPSSSASRPLRLTSTPDSIASTDRLIVGGKFVAETFAAARPSFITTKTGNLIRPYSFAR